MQIIGDAVVMCYHSLYAGVGQLCIPLGSLSTQLLPAECLPSLWPYVAVRLFDLGIEEICESIPLSAASRQGYFRRLGLLKGEFEITGVRLMSVLHR